MFEVRTKMAKKDVKGRAKEYGLMILLGLIVIILTPLVAGILVGISAALFGFQLFTVQEANITIAMALAAGISAALALYGIDRWLR